MPNETLILGVTALDFLHYQNQAKRTAVYPKQELINNLVYLALGLAGESGEVANAIKKSIRDDNGVVTPDRLAKITDEMGDVLWYLAMMCYELGISFEFIALHNVAKLKKRQRENTLHDYSQDDR